MNKFSMIVSTCLLSLALAADSGAQMTVEQQAAADAEMFAKIPAGYRIRSADDKNLIFRGDLNGDGEEDCVLIIEQALAPVGENSGDEMRGIMIFFKEGGGYRLAMENRNGLGQNSSESCGACGYRELTFGIGKGNLYFYYYWGKHNNKETFTFRYKNSEFELIGYDLDNGGKRAASVNFPAKKKVSTDCPKGKKCTETWTTFAMKEPILLRKIVDFPHLVWADYMKSTPGAGSFADARDGKIYWTTAIGGNTWMAENLNYRPRTGKSWCYNDTASYMNSYGRIYASHCDVYGRLYDWNTAKTACPAGYHLPSREEWSALAAAAEIDDYDEYGFSATGNGFSAIKAGYRDSNRNTFSDMNENAYWWTAAESGSDNLAYCRIKHTPRRGNENSLVEEKRDDKNNGMSVRCVQDANK
ncbi:hypothetical protein R80B4_03287 [Fibrobacteres bacterium R8-0-B4]